VPDAASGDPKFLSLGLFVRVLRPLVEPGMISLDPDVNSL